MVSEGKSKLYRTKAEDPLTIHLRKTKTGLLNPTDAPETLDAACSTVLNPICHHKNKSIHHLHYLSMAKTQKGRGRGRGEVQFFIGSGNLKVA